MKTAMQELIEWGDEMLLKHPQKILGFGEAIDKAVELLEKEKEQSINLIKQTCMFMGASIIDIEISKMEFEDIYNNYYNQNK
jgi:hypothetical protein